MATPGTTQRRLTPGSWLVYQLTGTETGGAGLTFADNGSPDLDPSQVAVTGPDGSQLTVYTATENDTITRNSKIYTAAVAFTVASSGVHTLTFNTSSVGQVLVTRSLGHTARSLAAPLGALGIGSLLVVTGLVLLFVGVFRRQRADRPAAFAFSGSGGWSPSWRASGDTPLRTCVTEPRPSFMVPPAPRRKHTNRPVGQVHRLLNLLSDPGVGSEVTVLHQHYRRHLP